MDEKKPLDFPIFTIIGDESFEEEVYQATTLHFAIQELADMLLKDIEDIKSIGKKLNIYVNNIIKRDEPFDYEKHIIIFNDDKELCIYTHDEVSEFLDSIYDDNDIEVENEDDLMDIEEDLIKLFDEETDQLKKLPPTEDRHKLNKKQLLTCEDLVNLYNVTYLEYEYSMVEFNEMNDFYASIIEGIKDDLKTVKYIDKVSNNAFETELFDNEKHELMLTKDINTGSWKFVYIRIEDHDKFMKLLENNAKNKQP